MAEPPPSSNDSVSSSAYSASAHSIHNDNQLEMEEVEGLISVTTKGTSSTVGGGTKRSNNNSSAASAECLASLCEQKNRNRIVTFTFILLALVLLWIQSSTMSADDAGPHVIDIEKKKEPSTPVSSSPPPPPPPPAATDDKTTTTDTPPPPPPPPEEEKKEEEEEEEKPKEKPKHNPKLETLPLDPTHDEINDDARFDLSEKYGDWHFWDGDVDGRPKNDYCSEHNNRDIPGDSFPDSSWQVDAVYVNHILNDADKLLTRAMEAIFIEYGHGKPLPPEKLTERMQMFHWDKVDMSPSDAQPPDAFKKRGQRDNGGWTTKRSYDGLVRRLLHAIVTNDTFTVVLAGHSAAKGAGNMFRQSYMMQFHKILEPIFARLGVKLITRNISQGGLGTIQGTLGFSDIFGSDIDLLLWDSGMTENPIPHHIDLFFRQALISGNRVPVIWGGPFGLLKLLHEECDVDVGDWGNGLKGIPETTDIKQMESLPYAAQRLKCTQDSQSLCQEERFNSVCWVDRPDDVKPSTKQLDHPESQVKWHPGWRSHQLTGRVITFQVLEALQSAVNTYSSATMSGQPIDDTYWHMTEYYDNIRTKVLALDDNKGECSKINKDDQLPSRLCKVPLKGRTQYTPRANYDESSLSSIIKKTDDNDGYVPHNAKKALYDGDDVHLDIYDIPDGSIDVYAVVWNRRRRSRSRNRMLLSTKHDVDNNTSLMINFNSSKQEQQKRRRRQQQQQPRFIRKTNNNRRLDEIKPGKGWEVIGEPQGTCDGTYRAVCGRSDDNNCILEGSQDGRGAIVGSEMSGWLVMTIPGKEVKEGIIILKLHTWHSENDNPRTNGWTAVNNDGRRRQKQQKQLLLQTTASSPVRGEEDNMYHDDVGYRRSLKEYNMPELPDNFEFDYAINGQITTLNKNDFKDKVKKLQRVVETITLLDDPNFGKDNGDTDVEVAIRLRGAGRKIVFGVTHLYWG